MSNLNTRSCLAQAEYHLRQALAGDAGCPRDELFVAWMRVKNLLADDVIDVEAVPVGRFDPATRRELEGWRPRG